MRHEDKRTGAISVAGVGVPVLLWVLGELEVHPPKIVLYALLVLSAVMIVGPWLVIGRHHWRERGRRLVRGTELVPAASTIQRGKDLWREIGAEQITFRVQPWNTMLGMLLRNRTA